MPKKVHHGMEAGLRNIFSGREDDDGDKGNEGKGVLFYGIAVYKIPGESVQTFSDHGHNTLESVGRQLYLCSGQRHSNKPDHPCAT